MPAESGLVSSCAGRLRCGDHVISMSGLGGVVGAFPAFAKSISKTTRDEIVVMSDSIWVVDLINL